MPQVQRVPRDGSANRRAWEDWGDVDPLWAILTRPGTQFGGWNIDEFFASGRQQIAGVMADADRLGFPARRATALDFGCGVGRLTRALGDYFDSVTGIDVASTMVRRANELHADAPGVTFVVNDSGNLTRFEDKSFDLVCSLLVLQHLPTRAMVETFLREFVRVLAPGGLFAVQLPSFVPVPEPARGLRSRLRLRSRLANGLRAVGVPRDFLYRRLNWRPAMPMSAIPIDDVVALLEAEGARVLEVSDVSIDDGGVESRVYYATR